MKLKILFLPILLSSVICCKSQYNYPIVVIETTVGKITLRLYDETPFHSENFIKLINSGFYNNQLFHRTIKNNIIQTGDSNSISAAAGQRLGYSMNNTTILAEINSKYYHKKGALAAARKNNLVNPEKKSSNSQFYIVQGQVYTADILQKLYLNNIHKPFTEEQQKTYCTIGGLPHLDNEYTVFGEVIDGFDIVEFISNQPVDKFDRPITDIKIINSYTLK